MNFSYNGADTSKIIKKYVKNGYNYTIEYLNGDISSFYSTNENCEQEIIDMMVEQINERQNKMDVKMLNNTKNIGLCISLFSTIMFCDIMINEKEDLLLIPTIGLLLGLKIYNDKRKCINELKKYKLFLEMTKNNPRRVLDDKWLDYIEFDKLYQIPLNINTIDDYSYRDIKFLSKKMHEKN